jgi:hypothetical protein
MIDLTGLTKSVKEEEPEKIYCKHCPGSVELSYCKEDSNDESPGMPYKKGDWQCPRCGNVRGMQKKREQKGPKLASSTSSTPQGSSFIAVLSTHPNYGTDIAAANEEDIDTEADEQLRFQSQGVSVSSETYFPKSGRRTIKNNS